MIAQIYILIVVLFFIFIWLKHFYLVHFKLNSYMNLNFKNEWDKMKENTGWYRPSWATLYFSKAIHEFIWKTDTNFNDKNISLIKHKIKKIIWELPVFFISVVIVTVFVISLGWL